MRRVIRVSKTKKEATEGEQERGQENGDRIISFPAKKDRGRETDVGWSKFRSGREKRERLRGGFNSFVTTDQEERKEDRARYRSHWIRRGVSGW